MIGTAEVNRRFSHHVADERRAAAHDATRKMVTSLASRLDRALPDGREKALAMTHLEEALFWANAAIAREGK